jgi:hypothetical protein
MGCWIGVWGGWCWGGAKVGWDRELKGKTQYGRPRRINQLGSTAFNNDFFQNKLS